MVEPATLKGKGYLGIGIGDNYVLFDDPAVDSENGESVFPGFLGATLGLQYTHFLTDLFYMRVEAQFGGSSEKEVIRKTDEWSCGDKRVCDYDFDPDYGHEKYCYDEYSCGYASETVKEARLYLKGGIYAGGILLRGKNAFWALGPKFDVGRYFSAKNNPAGTFLDIQAASELGIVSDNEANAVSGGIMFFGGGHHEIDRGWEANLGFLVNLGIRIY